MPTTTNTSKGSAQKKLEKEYVDIFGENKSIINENQSLEQPSPYIIIQSFTTYGAYEEPI